MESILILIVSLFLVAQGVGSLFPSLHTDGTFMSGPARLLLGVAFVVCAINPLLYFFSGKASSWIVLFAILFLFLILSLCRPAGRAGFFQFSRWDCAGSGSIAFIAVMIVLWRLFPLFTIGHITPFEGTGNHDELWYIFNAEHLINNGLQFSSVVDPDFPLQAAVGVNIAGLPRIGSESILVFLASLSGMSVYKAYPLVFTIFSLLFFYAGALGLRGPLSTRRLPLFVALFVIAISPVALQIFGNGNFATLLGLAFLGGYYWFLRNELQNECRSLLLLAPAAFFLGAIVITYPELLAVAFFATALMSLQFLLERKISWFSLFKKLLVCTVLAALVCPMSALKAVRVLTTANEATNGFNSHYPHLFSSMSLGNLVTRLVTFDLDGAEWFRWLEPAFSSIFLAAMVFAPRKILRSTMPLLVGSLLVLSVFWVKGYGYGGMKAVQFLALPFATILGGSIAGLIFAERVWGKKSLLQAFSENWRIILGVVAFSSLLFFSGSRSVTFNKVARSKHLSKNLEEMASISPLLGADAVVYVDDSLGQHPFMVSRWLAYLLKETRLVYAPSLHPGGYIHFLGDDFDKRLSRLTHIFRAREKYVSVDQRSPIFQNSNYEVVEIGSSPIAFCSNGFHHNEGSRRWMGQAGSISILGGCSKGVSFEVVEKFAGCEGPSILEVSAEGVPTMCFEIPEEGCVIEYPLTKNSKVVLIRSIVEARSPKSLGWSADARDLTFSFRNIEFLPCDTI